MKLKELENAKNIIYTEENDYSLGPILKLKNTQNGENMLYNTGTKSDSGENTPEGNTSQANLEDKKLLMEAFSVTRSPTKNEANIILSPQSI